MRRLTTCLSLLITALLLPRLLLAGNLPDTGPDTGLPPLIEQDVLAFPPMAPTRPDTAPLRPVRRTEIDILPAHQATNADNTRQQTMEIIPLPQVFFPHNESILSHRAQSLLGKAARYIQKKRHLINRILINGHADEVATLAYNQDLGQQRAAGVRRFLIAHGVDRQMLYTTSLGESLPIDENWEPNGRRHNRRVEVYILLINP